MAVMCEEENRCLTAAVSGELDHHRAKEVMEELDRQIDAALPRKLTLDLSGLTFTDSSGHPAHLPQNEPAAGRDDCGPRPGPGPAGVPGGRAGKAGPI